ncbi:hypothetical protein DKX38_026243 [Salix brachista]|uniref:Reverse transcriptase/retrotransposon-derived protein RNase H-like domain-containing protein n=1 Tax=Salix brachista TaxID=2182728 RepID=A0A5N5JUR9_9ROSI|nr:hypothetical protein DKX38_026232 [Salix brachista]KAB5521924.1 hypothetical protein DKX38_026243 [Salix brachista]
MNENVVHLSKVLSWLREHKFFVKREKCEFASAEIMFLGHLRAVMSALVLKLPDFERPFEVHTDASDRLVEEFWSGGTSSGV